MAVTREYPVQTHLETSDWICL